MQLERGICINDCHIFYEDQLLGIASAQINIKLHQLTKCGMKMEDMRFMKNEEWWGDYNRQYAAEQSIQCKMFKALFQLFMFKKIKQTFDCIKVKMSKF